MINKERMISAIFVIISISAVLFGTIIFLYGQYQEPEIKRTKCYDRFTNEIIGEKCLNEIYPFQWGGLLLVLGVFSSALSVAWNFISDKENRPTNFFGFEYRDIKK
jgi:hypothetical protein